MNTHGICKHGIQWEFCESCNCFASSPDEIPINCGDCGKYRGWANGNEPCPRCGKRPFPYAASQVSCGINIETSDGGSSAYYDLPPNCQTLQDVIVGKGMSYTRGNIFKAAYRWDVKGLEYNLRKIKWFAEDALARLYAEEKGKVHGPTDD